MQRHPLDPLSLVAGLLFAGLSIPLLTGRVTAGTRHLTLVWAVGAVILGLGLLASGRRSHEPAVEAGPQSEAGPGTEHGTAGDIRED
jgi:hypothetical protein